MRQVEELVVNGERHQIEVDLDRDLLGVLREELGLTGSKFGCGEGRCGACTVLVDGMPARSCIVRIRAVAGREITTIEGLADGDALHPIQRAFLDHGAFQCGYCTTGMIVAVAGLLAEHPDPTDQQVADALRTNVCRCGTYPRISAAIRQAAEQLREDAR